MIKHNLVTANMVREGLGMKDHDDPFMAKGQYIECEEIANTLNDLIHSKCLYCDHGDAGCQCWNDE